MLLSLSIQNFTLVDALDVEFQPGMTAITGETGAGKSLVLDALGMALGDRGDTGRIRAGKDKMDVSAVFAVANNPQARQWLKDNDLDDGEECILRRTLNRDGRSRGFINGQPAPMQHLQTLGEMMIDIHSQHEHQSLLIRDTHRKLLDAFAGCGELAAQVSDTFRQWQAIRNQINELQKNSRDIQARREFLAFQVAEFEELGLGDGELANLEREQHLLAHGEQILRDCHQALVLCRDGEEADVLSLLSRACLLLQGLPEKSSHLQEAESLLSSALIQVDEASREIQHHIDHFDINPARLEDIESRLSLIYQLARKHRIAPEFITERLTELRDELAKISSADNNLDNLTAKFQLLEEQLSALEKQLTKARTAAASKFARAVNTQLSQLAMASATLDVRLTPLNGHGPHGAETLEFLVSTNPGQPPNSLNKVASGGELSRISLAIQVIAAQHTDIPTLVFDEVDVGVGGAIAEVIGRLLRDLGNNGQVICVTHLPQVASCAHHHLVASKTTDGASTESQLRNLEEEHRVQEIARMLGGAKITNSTVEHAAEMLRLSAG